MNQQSLLTEELLQEFQDIFAREVDALKGELEIKIVTPGHLSKVIPVGAFNVRMMYVSWKAPIIGYDERGASVYDPTIDITDPLIQHRMTNCGYFRCRMTYREREGEHPLHGLVSAEARSPEIDLTADSQDWIRALGCLADLCVGMMHHQKIKDTP